MVFIIYSESCRTGDNTGNEVVFVGLCRSRD